MPKRLTCNVRIRFTVGEEIALGPGKADLLSAIQREGSISSAAKALGMSYRRAWLLVETMNKCFGRPLVAASKGGAGGGGAAVTEAGLAVLAAFQRLQSDVEALIESRRDDFEALLRAKSSRNQTEF